MGGDFLVEGHLVGRRGDHLLDLVGDHSGYGDDDPRCRSASAGCCLGEHGDDVLLQRLGAGQERQGAVREFAGDPQRLWSHRGHHHRDGLLGAGHRRGTERVRGHCGAAVPGVGAVEQRP